MLLYARMLGLALAVVLAASSGGSASARAELEDCARRIEELKARHLAGQPVGRELVRLLVRVQELAVQLDRDRAEPPPPLPAMPSPEELRERADAARDDADRMSAAIAELDVRLADVRGELRVAESGGAFARAALDHHARAAEVAALVQRGRALQAQRASLVARRAHAEAAAASLEAEARAAEGAQ